MFHFVVASMADNNNTNNIQPQVVAYHHAANAMMNAYVAVVGGLDWIVDADG